MRTHVTGHHIAVAVGFEPTVGCPTQHFECCTFGRSDTLPRRSRGDVTVPSPNYIALRGRS
ncbi:hypothetical protein Q604_UNBC09347G0001, partial [human gut metagenome]